MGRMGHTTRAPTPAEIQQRCNEVRNRWTEAEWLSRSGETPPQWTPPACDVEGPWLVDHGFESTMSRDGTT